MRRSYFSVNNIKTIVWLFFRLLILNLILIASSLIISIVQSLIETGFTNKIVFPIKLYTVAFFLSNLLYTLGHLFEIIYIKLWHLKINIHEFEKNIFKTGVFIIVLIQISGVLIDFLNNI